MEYLLLLRDDLPIYIAVILWLKCNTRIRNIYSIFMVLEWVREPESESFACECLWVYARETVSEESGRGEKQWAKSESDRISHIRGPLLTPPASLVPDAADRCFLEDDTDVSHAWLPRACYPPCTKLYWRHLLHHQPQMKPSILSPGTAKPFPSAFSVRTHTLAMEAIFGEKLIKWHTPIFGENLFKIQPGSKPWSNSGFV